jgi:hypothetical protein
MDKSSKKSKKEVKEVASDDEVEAKPAEENTGKSRAWPKADNQMTKKILDLCN